MGEFRNRHLTNVAAIAVIGGVADSQCPPVAQSFGVAIPGLPWSPIAALSDKASLCRAYVRLIPGSGICRLLAEIRMRTMPAAFLCNW